MPFNISIPRSGNPLELTVELGQMLFVLGANGTGKSSLMPRFHNLHRAHSRSITAHRQNWFSSEQIDLSAQQKTGTEKQIDSSSRTSQSRWQDPYASGRSSIAIFDLVESQNHYSRAIADAFLEDNQTLLEDLRRSESPMAILNQLLRTSNLPIKLSVSDGGQIVASKQNGTPYSIARLSDGERNALLMAASVLTAKPEDLILIDEPERHLHRSITSPLLTSLFRKRQDCAFIISTHDIAIPLDNPTSRTVLIRGCTYAENEVQSWDAELVPADTEIDDSLKRDVLGSRRRILFVEGTNNSSN